MDQHAKAKQFIREHFYFSKETAHLHMAKDYKHYPKDKQMDRLSELFIEGRYYKLNEILWLYHRDTIEHSICTVPWRDLDDRTRLIDMPKELNKLLYEHQQWKNNEKYKQFQNPEHIYPNRKSWKALLQYNKTKFYLGTYKHESDAMDAVYNKRLEILQAELPKYTHNIFCNVDEAGFRGLVRLPATNEVIL
jgi:hypothetical protein